MAANANAKTMYYTEEGYKALTEEFEYLKTVRREEVKEALAVARSYGDLSENSEYDEARNEQAKVESRITELEQLILHAIVINEAEIDANKISLGSIVKIKNLDEKEEIEYSIVGTNEVDFLAHKISDRSPIGAALIGRKVGDKITVAAPHGEMHIKVISVNRAKANS